MFAFALWDRARRTLALARDRLGEKPLYYGWAGQSFLFGSELKALARHPAWSGEIDRDALLLFMRHNYVPAPHSIYRGIRKLAPGSYLLLGPGEREGTLTTVLERRRGTPARAPTMPFAGAPEEAADRLESLAAPVPCRTDGRRRAARRLPFGRRRFLDRRRADAGA